MDFLTHLNEVFHDNPTVELVLKEPFDIKLERASNLNNLLKSTTNFNYFLKSKIKLFSHKDTDTLLISESLFGSSLSLKKIFNNQDDTIKLIFWKDLHNLLLSYNEYLLTLDPTNLKILERIDKLQNNTGKQNHMQNSINKLLKTDNLNDTTNNMLNDIFSSFESSMNQSSGNPFNNIMNISQTITEKYKDRIENGEIDLGDLLKNMTNLPGMENMGGMVDMLSKQMQGAPETPKEKTVIDENFSTALVEQGDVNEQDSGMNVASLLKTVSSLGLDNQLGDLMSGGNIADLMSGNIGDLMNNTDGEGMPDIMSLFSKLGQVTNQSTDSSHTNQSQTNQSTGQDMPDIMNLFSKLGQATDQTQINELFEKELGIDMNAFTSQMASLNKQSI